MIRVVIADDHAVVRHGLAQLLATFDGVELAGEAEDGEAAVALCARERPDVVLMDLEMPGVDGIEATRRIKAEQADIAVVVLTSFSDRERILRAIDAGAAGYLLKDVEPAELVKAIESAARGDAPLDPRAASAILGARRAAAPAAELSDREREVLLLVAEGLPEQADRPAPGHQRKDGQGAPDERLQADRRDRPHAGRALGGATRPDGRA